MPSSGPRNGLIPPTLVPVPPNIIDEESSPSSLSVRENHNATLVCRSEGVPAPQITWRREDGQHILQHRVTEKSGEFFFRCFNPLVPGVQKIKIRNLTLNRLLVVEFVKKMGYYLDAHYSERQGLMG